MSAAVLALEDAGEVDLDALVARVCARVAPTWPLDRFIAVNPLWEQVERPIEEVSEDLARLGGTRLVVSRAWFREEWKRARLRREHLARAIADAGAARTVAQLEAELANDAPPPRVRASMLDVADELPDRAREMPWRDFAVNATSQLCAAYFDDGQAQLRVVREHGLYASWRRQCRHDHAPALLMGLGRFSELAYELPETARELFTQALRDLAVPEHEREAYLTSLLLDVSGWASWCAYLRWTRRLAGEPAGDELADLLAIRLAWEWMVHRAAGEELRREWRVAMASWSGVDAVTRGSQDVDWLLQRAAELAWQERMISDLSGRLRAVKVEWPVPSVQAVFCIDVRSEPFRRALEAQSTDVRTLGFAGFFGLPAEYRPLGAAMEWPHLPGLLAPRVRVLDVGASPAATEARASELRAASAWRSFKAGAASTFSFVESLGVGFAGKLLADSFLPRRERAGAGLRPRVAEDVSGRPLPTAERAGIAAQMLRAMSLTHGLARIVALIGHGSRTRNNPHAAGLDCGACCGQSGEVNARAAAALLNDADVRDELARSGLAIPRETWFVAGLHDTTTDDVALFDLDEVPPSHERDVAELRRMLESAGKRVRRERAPALGIADADDDHLLRAFRRRASDWSEVRPEWGLAGNAAFVIAARERTRGLDLRGRVFLHEYRAADDADGSILELMMTAPMIVTHWINFQYYASTVDNRRFGSGNKVLHNVVGGHIGVFEGNGGDLRIGLPLQSLHDGARWVHAPLRLSVFIEAPREAIARVLAKHPKVRALVENEWLYLFQLDAGTSSVYAYRAGGWVEHVGADG